MHRGNIPVRNNIPNLTDGDEHEVEDGDGAGEHVAGLVEDAPARGQRPTASYIFELSKHSRTFSFLLAESEL